MRFPEDEAFDVGSDTRTGVATVLELATGLALFVVPSLVGRLLFGQEFTGIVVSVAYLLGIAVIALGVCCWPGSTALCGMLTARSPRFIFFTLQSVANRWGLCYGQ